MSRDMYALLTPTPFRIPGNPGPLAIYYTPTAIVDSTGAPVLDAEGEPTFNAQFTTYSMTTSTMLSKCQTTPH